MVLFFKIAQSVTQYLCYFCKKMCTQDVSKIAQSGPKHSNWYLPIKGVHTF